MGFDPNDGSIRELFSRDDLREHEILIDNREKRRLERVEPEKRARELERIRRRADTLAQRANRPKREKGRARRKRLEQRLRAQGVIT